jgi:hypothetical protein
VTLETGRREEIVKYVKGLYIVASGRRSREVASGDKCGQMEASTRGAGSRTELVVRVGWSMPTGMFTKAIGQMTKPMVMASTCTVTELSILGTGRTISNMDREKRVGQVIKN